MHWIITRGHLRWQTRLDRWVKKPITIAFLKWKKWNYLLSLTQSINLFSRLIFYVKNRNTIDADVMLRSTSTRPDWVASSVSRANKRLIFNTSWRLRARLSDKPIEISQDVGENGSDLIDTTASIKGEDADHCAILN